MPVRKPYDETKVGEVLQINYAFLTELWEENLTWGSGNQTLREFLFSLSEDNLRAELKTRWKIDLPPPPGSTPPVRIMLVDIQNGRAKAPAGAFDPVRDHFYVLVMPPKPTRDASDPTKRDYKKMQVWNAAWYHAVNDGYGM